MTPVVLYSRKSRRYIGPDKDAAELESIDRPWRSETAARSACYLGPYDRPCRALADPKELRERAKESRRRFDERYDVIPVQIKVVRL